MQGKLDVYCLAILYVAWVLEIARGSALEALPCKTFSWMEKPWRERSVVSVNGLIELQSGRGPNLEKLPKKAFKILTR